VTESARGRQSIFGARLGEAFSGGRAVCYEIPTEVLFGTEVMHDLSACRRVLIGKLEMRGQTVEMRGQEMRGQTGLALFVFSRCESIFRGLEQCHPPPCAP
jgi:hypothetical protein